MNRSPAQLVFGLSLAAGCGGPGSARLVEPGCGDGVVTEDEECDDGGANSDELPGACRADCSLPRCGDRVVDDGEACDDGNTVGGDGCATCVAEAGASEVEPNEDPEQAQAWTGQPVHGALLEGDRDCFSIEIDPCEAIGAQVSGCGHAVLLELIAPDGTLTATGTPTETACAVLDPAREPGARYLAPGRWTVCASGLLGGDVPAYRIDLAPPADSSPWPAPFGEDPDGDQTPDSCDDDDDGDGITDLDDSCPDVPNPDDALPPTPSTDGFLRHWLAIGPFTDTLSPYACRPSDDQLLGDDAAARPALGDQVGDLAWRAHVSPEDRVDFLGAFGGVDAPREVYAAVYVRSEVERAVTLALGPDDGARAWLDGAEILVVDGCQGTNVDQFTAAATLRSGWNTLLVKVRDQGGGWGTFARFLEGGAPVLDLELSLDPTGPWRPDQTDTDGDGVGDVCDPD